MDPGTESPPRAAHTSALRSAGMKPPWRRIAGFALLITALLAIVYLSPLKDYLLRARELSNAIRAMGLLGPVVLVLGVGLLVALGFPRLLFCVIAGMALGFWQGLFWTQLGTLLGNYILFLIARASGGEWVRHLVGRRPRLSEFLHREGITGVILARQLPVPGVFINLGFGLVSIRHRDFLLGTIIGQLPEAVPCTMIGAGALKGSFAKSAGLIGLAVAAALLLWLAMRYWLRRKGELNEE